MNAQVEVNACIVVEYAVKIGLKPNVIWKEEVVDKVQSTVCCIQLYSDTSRT